MYQEAFVAVINFVMQKATVLVEATKKLLKFKNAQA